MKIAIFGGGGFIGSTIFGLAGSVDFGKETGVKPLIKYEAAGILPKLAGSRVLDIGCNAGYDTFLMSSLRRD